MTPRQLILLSPYRLPTETTLYLGDEEVAAFLNGLRALWHPASLAVAEGLPALASPYDHEEPGAGFLIAVPDNPPLMLGDDWEARARAAGACLFAATADWPTTFANLRAALLAAEPGNGNVARFLDLPDEKTALFHGLGFGCAQLEAVCEAMTQENPLGNSELVADVAAAVDALSKGEDHEERLRSAAQRLLEGRERAYAVTIHVVDLFLADGSAPFPAALDAGQPLTVLASGQVLERMPPEKLALLRERVAAGLAEVVGGTYREREETLLPLESQWANIRLGQKATLDAVGQEAKVYARRAGGLHASLPLWLQSSGLGRALLVPFDESLVPSHSSTIVSWPSADGKQVDAFARVPQPADSPQTWFHLAHHLHQTIMQDQTATLALVHKDKPACVWYSDWLALARLAPVLGKWSTLSTCFDESSTGDYASAAAHDDFNADHLQARVSAKHPRPVSGFAAEARQRRKLDAALTFAAMLHALRGSEPASLERLQQLEDRYERGEAADVDAALDDAAKALASRLTARGQANAPGWLVLNPCSFARRVALELPDCAGPIAVGGHVKASQLDGALGRAVVEVPALGFAWVPRAPGPPPANRLKMADERTIRNEFLEAEIDPATGGLRSLRDVRSRIGRLGQQLAFNPGGTMRAAGVQVTSAGPALAEIVSEGDIVDAEGRTVCQFRQRFRAWMGRPVLEIRVELKIHAALEGYPWHSYLASRFAWRDDNAPLLRGVCGATSLGMGTRPESPDFLELRIGKTNCVILPGGLPFHQRHGSRMLDVLLATEGEETRVFDLAVALDREQPMQTALGIVSPSPAVPCPQGPPHVGATGWLFHLDASNVLLTALRPEAGDAVAATLLEIAGNGGRASLRCARNPVSAKTLDLKGNELLDPAVEGDAVAVDISPSDLVRVLARFS
ncbi:MAG: hypothetical protein K2W96_28895 [Gemmataceae bacterium]|nr:hypothetical protein [Gemmataceae bacterium]